MTRNEFAAMVDMVELSPSTPLSTVDALIADACENHFHSLGCPYCYHPYVMEKLRAAGMDGKIVLLGGGGFPDGNWPTEAKLASIAVCLSNGCGEIDLTTNLGWIKSGMWEAFHQEVAKVRRLTRGVPMKAILHTPMLTKEETCRACEILLAEGVDYVKTDTGRSPAPTTVDQVRLLREIVGDAMKIKASGGIRTVDTVLEMAEAGADRFGVSRSSAMRIYAALPER